MTLAVPEERGAKRPREEEAVEGEREAKRAKTTGILGQVHELVELGRQQFSGKSLTEIAQVIETLRLEIEKGSFASLPKEQIKELKACIRVIHQRLRKREDASEILPQIREILTSLKPQKKRLGIPDEVATLVDPDAAYLKHLMDTG